MVIARNHGEGKLGERSPVAVITGGSAGVGRASAIALASSGWDVALIARGRAGLEDACAEISRIGARCLALEADVADADAVDDAAARAEQGLGPIHVWVNAAMVTVFAPVSDMGAEEFRRVTEVTYLGQVHGTMAALKRMRTRDRGTIVQVGSALSYRAIPLQSAYCAAKFAVRGFTDSVRAELAHDGSRVRISMVQLPAVNTPQFIWARSRLPGQPQPLPPIFDPAVAGRAVVHAARAAPRELWVGSASLKAILGSMLAPGLGDRFLAREAYAGQQRAAPRETQSPDNLFQPVHGKHATRGPFRADRRAGLRVSGGAARAALASTAVGVIATSFVAGLLTGRRR